MLFFDMDLARNGECVGAANSTFLCAQQYDILPDMKPKDHYNVLAVYSLRYFAGREHFSGVLDAMSNTRNWHLTMVRPKLFASCSELVDDNGEPYDGFILSMPGSDDVMKHIAQSQMPTVLVNITDRRLSARCNAVASVWTDNADIGRQAAQHLLGRGEYRSAGYVHELDHQFYSDERMTAFRQAMKRGGCETSVFPEGADFFLRLRKWVRELPKPAAVMACSDMRAADVINACKAERISVPSQVAVVGVDYDVSQHAKCGMSISSVVINSRLMGRQAVRELDFLFRHPKSKSRPHEVLIPAKEVFAGESTARSIPATRLVKMALDFISENRLRAVATDEVVAHLGCSRRLAELRFSQIAGVTIHQAIEKARMDEVHRRLKAGASANAIANELQFTSPNQLYRIYKRHFGHTIRQDRAS